jgi:TolB-like protein
MASSSSPTSIVFPPFRLDLRAGQLLRDRTPVHLRPKTFAVLCYLAERPGELVTKDALLDAVWNDVVVSQDVVRISAGELRAALDDDWTSPRFIETVHRRGYRFVAALENDRGPELGASGNAATADGILVGHAPALPDRPSIVVLPFTNMSGDAEQDYFADGITEEIITTLSHSQNLRVAARHNTFQYKSQKVDTRAVGRELRVRYLVEGSVRRSGQRVRIGAQHHGCQARLSNSVQG